MQNMLQARAAEVRERYNTTLVDSLADRTSRQIMLDVPGLVETVASHETRVAEHHGNMAWAASVGVEWPLHDRVILDSEAVR